LDLEKVGIAHRVFVELVEIVEIDYVNKYFAGEEVMSN
jgi:hypothetical protein